MSYIVIKSALVHITVATDAWNTPIIGRVWTLFKSATPLPVPQRFRSSATFGTTGPGFPSTPILPKLLGQPVPKSIHNRALFTLCSSTNEIPNQNTCSFTQHQLAHQAFNYSVNCAQAARGAAGELETGPSREAALTILTNKREACDDGERKQDARLCWLWCHFPSLEGRCYPPVRGRPSVSPLVSLPLPFLLRAWWSLGIQETETRPHFLLDRCATWGLAAALPLSNSLVLSVQLQSSVAGVCFASRVTVACWFMVHKRVSHTHSSCPSHNVLLFFWNDPSPRSALVLFPRIVSQTHFRKPYLHKVLVQ